MTPSLTSPSVTPSVPTDTSPPKTREYWHAYLTKYCLTYAALLNLVAIGEPDLGKLPAHVHELAVRVIAELVVRACRGEMARGGRRSPRIHQDALGELWRALRPFAQRDEHGRHYVEHLVGSAEVREEFLKRTWTGE